MCMWQCTAVRPPLHFARLLTGASSAVLTKSDSQLAGTFLEPPAHCSHDFDFWPVLIHLSSDRGFLCLTPRHASSHERAKDARNSRALFPRPHSSPWTYAHDSDTAAGDDADNTAGDDTGTAAGPRPHAGGADHRAVPELPVPHPCSDAGDDHPVILPGG